MQSSHKPMKCRNHGILSSDSNLHLTKQFSLNNKARQTVGYMCASFPLTQLNKRVSKDILVDSRKHMPSDQRC